MGLSIVNLGSGGNNTSATTVTATLGGTPASNSTIVFLLGCDNAGSNGNFPGITSIVDSNGNTWTFRDSQLNDPGGVIEGTALYAYTTNQDVAALASGDTVVVTFNTSVIAKVWTLTEVATNNASATVSFLSSGSTSGSGTAATINSTSIASGNAIVAGIVQENSTSMTADSDTTNGSWSTNQNPSTGSGTAGQRLITQGKVVTAAGAQTYNSTISSSDWAAAWLSFAETTIAVPGVVALALTVFAPIIQPRPETCALTLTALAPYIPGSRDDLPPTNTTEDMVWESTTSTGLGTIVLAGAVANRRTVAQEVADGTEQTYRIAMVSGGQLTGEWEIVRATYDAGTNSLTRVRVLNNSYKMNQFIGWAAGTKWVNLVHSADDTMTRSRVSGLAFLKGEIIQ